MLTQRSSDFFLASNYNTMTATLMVHVLCHLTNCGYVPGDVIHVLGDTHLYENHIKQTNRLVNRQPLPMPKLVIKNKKYTTISDFDISDFQIIGYDYYPGIKAKMAV